MIYHNRKYKNIYIFYSRADWLSISNNYITNDDLVLTFDFGLKNLIENNGGHVRYIDSLCSAEEMQKNNFLAAEFLKNWNYDESGEDIFSIDQDSFGFSFRIEFWSEYLFYVRLRANLEKIKSLDFIKIISCKKNYAVNSILYEIALNYEVIDVDKKSLSPVYYFDVHRYMQSQLHGYSLKDFARKILIFALSNICFFLDLVIKRGVKKVVYIQPYHPTIQIIEELKKDKRLRVVTSSLMPSTGWKKFISQRLIPLNLRMGDTKNLANQLLDQFKKKRCKKLILADGIEISVPVYQIIESQIGPRVLEALRVLKSTKAYIKKQPINLEVMIANIGFNQTIVDCVLKGSGVNSYLIINGLLPAKFGDESKYATFINSYSDETKKNYFKGASNVICLGDPRMDQYAQLLFEKKDCINRDNPIIGIGSAGFNSIDLISHVAFEFDFIFDVLKSFQELKNNGYLFSIIIKVRPNAVLSQYKSFVNEYFSDLDIKLEQSASMINILKKLDLYISFYSQTLIEAACLGIPVIYYKKDREFLDPPFDAKSELVTVDNVSALKQAFIDFQKVNPRFDAFLDRSILEKYVGPLDGKNLDRNLDFIYGLLDGRIIGRLN